MSMWCSIKPKESDKVDVAYHVYTPLIRIFCCNDFDLPDEEITIAEAEDLIIKIQYAIHENQIRIKDK